MKASACNPILALVALAGGKEAAIEAAFSGLERAVEKFLLHGTKNILEDTVQALKETKGKKAREIEGIFLGAYASAQRSWETIKKTAPETVAPRARAVVAAAAAELQRLEDIAAAAKAAKKAAKAQALAAEQAQAAEQAKAAEQALAAEQAQEDPLQAALTFLRRAAAGGSDAALDGIVELAREFLEAVETA